MEILTALLGVAVNVFAVCSMLSVGFRNELSAVLAPLRDIPGIITAVAANFVLVPLLALGILQVIPLDRPQARHRKNKRSRFHEAIGFLRTGTGFVVASESGLTKMWIR